MAGVVGGGMERTRREMFSSSATVEREAMEKSICPAFWFNESVGVPLMISFSSPNVPITANTMPR